MKFFVQPIAAGSNHVPIVIVSLPVSQVHNRGKHHCSSDVRSVGLRWLGHS
jgi:hypothetical protein